MVEKLIIDNFAGIQHLEIEVKKINIMIGPQASGKSVCAKLLFYFKEFVSDLVTAIENDQNQFDLDSFYLKKFIRFFPEEFGGLDGFNLRYENDNRFIEISKINADSKLTLESAEIYKKEFSDLKKIYIKLQQDNLEVSQSQWTVFDRSKARLQLLNHIQSLWGKASIFVQVFIPAGRAFFSNIQNHIFTFLSSNNSLDPFIEKLGLTYESMKNLTFGLNHDLEKTKLYQEIEELVYQVLQGNFLVEKGNDYLRSLDGRKINIANISSGQQEALPLVVILSKLPFLPSLLQGKTIYIEEPEAHIFPLSQKHIVELIATVFNTNPDGLQFFITTHSPYILTATNNLLQAGLIYQDANDEVIKKLEKIVPRYKALFTEDVAVYSLMDGSCQSIISEETGLIDTNIIDSVSEELAIEFDQLLDLI
ncbi:AAA family ATPase [Planktothrix sp. FACHB-1365]|uniref:AAA family ATPase n=1 Tax=Planktothrix sp. FACHB-1365 TaxID=2692855 RepID=UPI001688E43D|nr:ATP-binding protein [Planktothrix sp. FACHB-1365]MBD2484654.1 ATP-binding protein [Planktothrix sp. FACHB-1365]